MRTDNNTLIVIKTTNDVRSELGVVGTYGALKGMLPFVLLYTFPDDEEKELYNKYQKKLK